MNNFSELTVAEILNGGIYNTIESSSDLSDTEIAIAYKCGNLNFFEKEIKLPKEVVLHYLGKSKAEWRKAEILKRPDVAEYLEEAINVFIENWSEIRIKNLEEEGPCYCTYLPEKVANNLIKEVKEKLVDNGVSLTWNNVRILFKEAKLCRNYTHGVYIIKKVAEITGEAIPEDLQEEIKKHSS